MAFARLSSTATRGTEQSALPVPERLIGDRQARLWPSQLATAAPGVAVLERQSDRRFQTVKIDAGAPACRFST